MERRPSSASKQGPESDCMEISEPVLPAELRPILGRSYLGATPFSWLSATEVPQPFQRLLVHDHDMTSELASFHGDSMALQVLHARQSGDIYLREVVLLTAATGAPVEYGLIEILLDAFPSELRPRILAGGTPLGAILNDSGLGYRSEPQGFFTVPSETLHEVFPQSPGGAVLYGRYNHLVRRDNAACLARILEILPSTS